MHDTSSPPTPTRAGSGAARPPPPWAEELLEVLTLRGWVLAGVAVAVGLVGSMMAALLPEVLPPNALAGAAVGVGGYLLGLAAAIAVDAGDRTIRGGRHVEATGAVLAATITRFAPSLELVAWVERLIRDQKGLRLAIAATGTDPLDSGRLVDELGIALAHRGWHVLVTDLERADLGWSEQGWPGASEVCGGEVRLSEVVEFHPSLHLARLGPGRDRARALREFPMLASRLPHDVDLLLVALPGLGHEGALPALAAVDRALLLAATNVTRRAELLAALDSTDEIRVPTDVVLVHGLTVVESEPSVDDPTHRWTEEMVNAEHPIDPWSEAMVTVVPAPREASGATSESSPHDAGSEPEVAEAGPHVEAQVGRDATDTAPARREFSASPQRPGNGASRRIAPQRAVDRREVAPDEEAFGDAEADMRLAAWLTSLEEDESGNEAGRR